MFIIILGLNDRFEGGCHVESDIQLYISYYIYIYFYILFFYVIRVFFFLQFHMFAGIDVVVSKSIYE